MKFLSILLVCFSLGAFATDTVRINNPSAISVTGLTNVSFSLISDSPSGDGTADTAPARTYLPIQSGSSLPYSTLKKTAPGISSLFNVTSAAHQITFPLLLTIGGTAKYIYVAVRGGASGSSYYVSGKSSSTFSSLSSSAVSFSLSPKDICKSIIANSISTVCNTGGAFDPASTTNAIFKPMLYFFLTDQTLGVDGLTSIDPANADYTGGIFFEAQMSNYIYPSTSLIVSLSSLRKGDRRLIGTYSSNSSMDSNLFKKVIAYQYDDNATAINTNETMGSTTAGSIISRDIATSQSGEFTLDQLTNGTTYNISIAFQDKFLFATTLSTSLAGSPTEIQQLLKKQACYILTAGFGEEHYVTNYFRSYRDHILAHSWIGQKFIKYYYATAPHYAIILYQHNTLRFLVRLFAYFLYFVLNFSGIVLIIVGSSYFINIMMKKKLTTKAFDI